MSYDHHNHPLNYRFSQAGVASNPESVDWNVGLFGTTLHELQGASGPWAPLTYPRFERTPTGGLLFEFRIGMYVVLLDLIAVNKHNRIPSQIRRW